MQIAGVNCNSFIDYPSKIAYVVFCGGCNFDCWYCHNRPILRKFKILDEQEVLSDIKSRGNFIDGVVISGGEPTLQFDLVEFIKKLSPLPVKLDTNGSKPDVIETLLKNNLLDYIAMDIKAPFSKYATIACCEIDINAIKRSVEIIRSSGLNYEFRTTFSPDLTKEDILEISKHISGAKLYTLGKFVDHENIKKKLIKPHDFDYLEQTAKEANRYVLTKLRR